MLPAGSLGYFFSNIPCTTKLVEVPTKVHVPPKIVAYDSGINSCCLGQPIILLQRSTTGIIMATMGVLLKNALMNKIGTVNRSCAPAMVVGRPNIFPI